MKALVLLIVSCSLAFAQSPLLTGSGIDWTKPSASSVPDPTTVPGLQNWWVSSDLTNNLIVTNWVDRISGYTLTNGNTTAGIRPTNSTYGVTFDGTSFLTNRMLTVSNKCAFAMVIRPLDTAPAGTPIILGDIPDNIGYGMQSGKFELQGDLYFNANTNNMVDWIQTVNDPTATTPSRAVTTNNVVLASSAGVIVSGTVIGCLGGSAAVIRHAKFQILEFLWYTNNIATNTAWRTTLHTYFTNTYPFITP